MLLLKLDGGLCNRLRAMMSARALATETDCPLTVFWKTDSEMNVCWRDLFLAPPDFKILDMKPETIWSRLLFSRYKKYATLPNNPQVIEESLRKSSKWKPWTLFTCSEFYRPDRVDYSFVRPIPSLADEIARVWHDIGGDRVEVRGIHIRRTDNAKSIEHSPDRLFFERIRLDLQQNPDLVFFLATDDDSVKVEMRERFGVSVYTRGNLAKREDAQGVLDAVIDLFLLSKCSKIYGSYWSSFSGVAADISNVPLEILSI